MWQCWALRAVASVLLCVAPVVSQQGTAEEGMSGSPIISATGEMLGIVTLAGTGKFRGVSFGNSFAEAAPLLRTQGVMLSTDFAGHPAESANRVDRMF
jgi:hypothetical protein